ncbi:DUF1682-domain-containing protein [Ramaria rubella]|nr:DUF1682-domain-containing protein [Ramaria rubella]
MLAALSLAALAAACGVSAQGITGTILNLARQLSPPPILQSQDWNGTEYRYGRLVFRPAQFKVEGILLSCIAAYFLLWFVGKSQNYRRATAWFEAHLPLLESQFSSPMPASGTLVQDGASDFFNYSTGRRGVMSLHTTASLLPRHDILLRTYDFLWTLYDLTYTPRDEIQLDFTLPPSNPTPPFVWGIIKKDEMAQMRRTRWDLTFTKGTEFSLLPVDLCVFSEAADITESILKFSPSLPLTKVLSDPTTLQYFRSLIITDQPSERPMDGPLPAADRSRHVILTLHSPPPSDAAATLPIVSAIFTLIDLLDAKLPLRPETKSKLKTRRDEVDADLVKEAKKERNEEQEDNKRAAKKKAEEEKIARLSASEQKKLEEKERKKALRKQQGKMVSRK